MSEKHDFSWRLDGEEAIQKGFIEPYTKASATFNALTKFKKDIQMGMQDIFKRDFQKLGGWKRWWADDHYFRWVADDGLFRTSFKDHVYKTYNPTDTQERCFFESNRRDNDWDIFSKMNRAVIYHQRNLKNFGDYVTLYLENDWQKFILKYSKSVENWIKEEDFFLNGEPLCEESRKRFLEIR